MQESNIRIKSLWIGKRLSPIETLCINSYLQNGHKFELNVYDNVKNVPPDVDVIDANVIVPEFDIFSITLGSHKNSFAIFADYFRYKLLFDLGGWWSDLDAVCLKPYDFNQEYLFINEKTRYQTDRVANGVIKCPSNSPIMQYCYTTVKEIINSRKIDQWGQTGPKLLESAIAKFNLAENCVPSEFFIPFGYFEVDKIISGEASLWKEKGINNSYSVHIFNSMWDVKNYPKFGFFNKIHCLKI